MDYKDIASFRSQTIISMLVAICGSHHITMDFLWALSHPKRPIYNQFLITTHISVLAAICAESAKGMRVQIQICKLCIVNNVITAAAAKTMPWN